MPVQLTDAASDRALGTVTDQQFQVLVDALEEEAEDDTDYYVNVDTIDMLEAQGSDRELVTLLRAALNGREEMDIRWQRL